MIEIELNQQIKLERTDIFTILNPPIMNTEYFSMYLILLLFFSFVIQLTLWDAIAMWNTENSV